MSDAPDWREIADELAYAIKSHRIGETPFSSCEDCTAALRRYEEARESEDIRQQTVAESATDCLDRARAALRRWQKARES